MTCFYALFRLQQLNQSYQFSLSDIVIRHLPTLYFYHNLKELWLHIYRTYTYLAWLRITTPKICLIVDSIFLQLGDKVMVSLYTILIWSNNNCCCTVKLHCQIKHVSIISTCYRYSRARAALISPTSHLTNRRANYSFRHGATLKIMWVKWFRQETMHWYNDIVHKMYIKSYWWSCFAGAYKDTLLVYLRSNLDCV